MRPRRSGEIKQLKDANLLVELGDEFVGVLEGKLEGELEGMVEVNS